MGGCFLQHLDVVPKEESNSFLTYIIPRNREMLFPVRLSPQKTKKIYNIKTKQVEVTNIKPTVSFRASKCLVGELNKKKFDYKQKEIIIDSDDCKVIKSQPNQNQTDSLQLTA